MSLPVEEDPIINADIRDDVTSSSRNLVEVERGKDLIPDTIIKDTHFFLLIEHYIK